MAEKYEGLSVPVSILSPYLVVGRSIFQQELHHPSPIGFRVIRQDGAEFRSEDYASYFPEVERIVFLRRQKYRLVRPIIIMKSVVGDTRYVGDDEMHCWGIGATFAEARADYETNLVDMYEDPANSEEPLSRLAEETLRVLRNHLSHQ